MKRTRPAVTAVDVAVDCLAVARLTRLLQDDEIPVGAAREWALDVFAGTKIETLLTCPWCSSVWFGFFAVWARHRYPRAWSLLARALAASQVTGQLAELGDR